MRLGKLALISSSLLITLSTSIPNVAQAAQNTPTSGAPPAPASIDVPDIQTLHVTAREVVVDVMVTDAQGNSVNGLQQSDFSIEENGHPQTIRSFREYTPATQPPEPPFVRLPPGVYTNSHSTPATGPVDIFLLDAMNGGISVFQAKRQVLEYLRTMPPGTRVAIFWLAETGLHTLQPFTSDRAALIQAVSTDRVDVGAIGNAFTRQMTTMKAFNQLAAFVSGIKGRKNLFWFTPGMPINLLRDGGYGWGNIDMTMVHHLMDTYELLTAAQVAVYPVDPRGIVGLGRTQLKDEAVAEQTGGEAIYNTNDLTTAVAKAIDKGSQFYSISYIPPNQKDDSHYHTIKIELDQPGLTLVYRKGYNAERLPTVDNPEPGPALMKASMEGHAPAATQLLFDAAVQPATGLLSSSQSSLPKPKMPPKSAPRTIPYDILFGLPASQIAFAKDESGKLHGALEFDAVAYDITGTRVALLTQTVNMPLSAGQYDAFAAAPFHFTQQIDLPLGQLSLHVGIYDTISHKVGTLEIPLTVRENAR
jgi:VWFA-related protein